MLKYQIICIKGEEWSVITTVDSKREARKWIERNRDKYPHCRLNFIREGFEPIL